MGGTAIAFEGVGGVLGVLEVVMDPWLNSCGGSTGAAGTEFDPAEERFDMRRTLGNRLRERGWRGNMIRQEWSAGRGMGQEAVAD